MTGSKSRILVTSASGANGDGYGTLLSFSGEGELAGPFSDHARIADPRGLSSTQEHTPGDFRSCPLSGRG
jgi:hypothetical protein